MVGDTIIAIGEIRKRPPQSGGLFICAIRERRNSALQQADFRRKETTPALDRVSYGKSLSGCRGFFLRDAAIAGLGPRKETAPARV
jgi:hypothetical protein